MTERVVGQYDTVGERWTKGALPLGGSRGVVDSKEDTAATTLDVGLGGTGWTAKDKQVGFGTDMKRSMMMSSGKPSTREEECLEKRVYYRIISGEWTVSDDHE